MNIETRKVRWSIKNSFSKRNYRHLSKKRIIGSNGRSISFCRAKKPKFWQKTKICNRFVIASKKSVRTFKLRIEPTFLSHAECGESLQNQPLARFARLPRRNAPRQPPPQNGIWIKCGECITFARTHFARAERVPARN